jgi:hypothetical protein
MARCELPFCYFMSGGSPSDDAGWTEARQRLHAQLTQRNALLAEYYASAIYFLSTPGAPARMSHLAHAVRELCLHLPDVVGVVRLERSQSENRSADFLRVWEGAGLADDAAGFPVCTESGGEVPMCLVPRPVVQAAAEMIVASRVRGTAARRAAMMIAEPHAPGARVHAERDPTVQRWNTIVGKKLFAFVHAFDKSPSPIGEEDLHLDFEFLEGVMRGVLAPLEQVADLDELLAETTRQPEPVETENLTVDSAHSGEPRLGASDYPQGEGAA